MCRVLLVHGIRAKDNGMKSMGAMKKKLSKVFKKIHRVSYGYILIPITNRKAVTSIIKEIKEHKDKNEPIMIVAYSNGCWAAVQVAELGYKIDHLVLISPALHRAHAIPEQVNRVDVFYSKGDRVVELGRIYRLLVNLLPWNWSIFGKPHNWGAMGRYGYQGNDKRIFNHNMGDMIGHFWYRDKVVINHISTHIINLYKES